MNLSGIDSRSLVGRLLRLPLKLIPSDSVVPIMQGALRGKRWIAGSSTHGCWLGSYEFSKQSMFIQHVKENQVVYDIGAHVGFYTLLSAHLVGEHGSVIAFEPLPRNIRYLRRHLELNRVRNVTLFEKAVSDHAGTATFQIGSSSFMGHLTEGTGSTTTITVETIALDEWIAAHNLPIPNVIKVDIEGAEMDFLTGAKHLLETNEVTLFLATHGQKVHKECLEFLRGIQYTVSSLDDEPVETTSELVAVKVRA